MIGSARDGGGAFLLGPGDPARIRLPEDLSDDQRAIALSVDEFWRRAIAPSLDRLLSHEPGVGRRLLREAAALGLFSMQIPARFGGLDLDLSSVIVAVEHLAEDPSYLGWHLGHAGIGTRPLVWYGTEAQQARYLPRLASLDLLAAFALTEPQSGSDVRGLTTRADLAPDGRAFRLNGQKMWITNGGEADLFTVFAKVGGEHLTAFLVERAFGVRSGAEERKMGLSGTSTTALYFDDVIVPAENVLGEIGRGQAIAYNVLNAGRLEMGPLAIRGVQRILRVSIEYAHTRRAFGRPIAAFGAIQQKLAECATRLYALEAAVWRVVGLIEERVRSSASTAGRDAERRAFEEYAAECAIVKVLASEVLDFAADEGVQIHGGYGYHRDYYVEQAYRDARVNRIFEGTNEINRLLISSLLIGRAASGRLVMDEPDADRRLVPGLATAASIDTNSATADALSLMRAAARLALEAVRRAFGDAVRDQQEMLMLIADMIIDLFAAESAHIRAVRTTAGSAFAADAGRAMSQVYTAAAARRVAGAALALAAALPDDADRTGLAETARALDRLATADTIGLRRRIASSLGPRDARG